MATGIVPIQTEIFTCWKEIAVYMGKGVRTVQRWEQTMGLPVRRPVGTTHKSAVVARRGDLDMWLEKQWSDREQKNWIAVQPAISQEIQISHQLRTANHLLVHEIAQALQTLAENCDRLMANRQKRIEPIQ